MKMGKKATSVMGRRARRLAVAVALGAVLGGAVAHADEPTDPFGFQGFTAASSLRLSYEIPGYVAPRPIDGAGPISEATLDVFAGHAFASLPYPGDDGVNYPAVVNLATGQTPPGYPFYAVATSDQPESEVSDPSKTFLLTAKVAPGSAVSEAKFRPSAGDALMSGATSMTTVTATGEEVVATAESLSQGIKIADLTVGSVRSKSVTVYQAGSAPVTTSETLVEGGRVGDALSFSFGPEGLSVNQNGVPIPAGEGLATLNKALEPAGLKVSFAAITDLVGGREAAAFVVRSEHPSPIPGANQGILTLRFGQALSGVVAGESFADIPTDVGEVTPEPAPADSAAAPTTEPAATAPTVNDLGSESVSQAPALSTDFSSAPSTGFSGGFTGGDTGSGSNSFSGDTSGALGGTGFEASAPAPAAVAPGAPVTVGAGANLASTSASASSLYGVLALAGLMFIAVFVRLA